MQETNRKSFKKGAAVAVLESIVLGIMLRAITLHEELHDVREARHLAFGIFWSHVACARHSSALVTAAFGNLMPTST